MDTRIEGIIRQGDGGSSEASASSDTVGHGVLPSISGAKR